jgi:hypothetical protein
MMKIKIILFLLISLQFYSQSPDSIKFDILDKKTNARELFISKIINKDIAQYKQQDDTLLNSLQSFNKNKTTRYGSEFKIHSGDPDEENRPVIGNAYALELYSDEVYAFENLHFNRFTLFSDLKNNLIGYELFNDKIKQSVIDSFIKDYSKKYKHEMDNNETRTLHFFEMKDKNLIFIIPKNYTKTAGIAVPGEKRENERSEPVSIFTIFENATSDQEDFVWRLINR